MIHRNSLRCETCDYWDRSEFPKRWVCNKIREWFDYPQINLITKIGCGSHSDINKFRTYLENEINSSSDNKSICDPNDRDFNSNIEIANVYALREFNKYFKED